MGPVNFVKGYGIVVNPVEDDNNNASFSSTHRKAAAARKRRVAVAVAFAVLLTLIAGATVAVLVHKSRSRLRASSSQPSSSSSPDPIGPIPRPIPRPLNSSAPSSSSPNSTELLRTVCAVTQHPDSCFESMSSLPAPTRPDPEHYLNVSIRVAIGELVNVSSLPSSLIPKVNGRGAKSALKDCEDLFSNALSQLNESVGLLDPSPKGAVELSAFEINSMQTWISAAMTDQDTCLNGLEEMNSTVIGEVKARVQRSNEYMSNTLAILNNFPKLHKKFGIPVR